MRNRVSLADIDEKFSGLNELWSKLGTKQYGINYAPQLINQVKEFDASRIYFFSRTDQEGRAACIKRSELVDQCRAMKKTLDLLLEDDGNQKNHQAICKGLEPLRTMINYFLGDEKNKSSPARY